MLGYNGKILYVDLSKGETKSKPFDEDFAKKYIGGNGFAVKIIYDMVSPDTEPLSDDNVVVIALGPFNGSPIWGTGRGHLASISPQTNMFADSNFGGDFAAKMKKAGFDAVAITGKSDKPVYLMINDGEVEIKDASSLWGKDTEETHKLLMESEGQDIETACIGPGGENQVIYACIMCSGKRVSAAGRGGIGAVLGYKNCKAVVVKGDAKIDVADKESLSELLKKHIKDVREKARMLTELGTPFLVNAINSKGMLATRNNTRETFDKANNISGQLIKEKYRKKNIACTKCPIACGKLVHIDAGEFEGRDVKMAEYETIYSIGTMLENDDIISILNGNFMCDLMGIDTISFGVTLSFIAECLEKGIVSQEEIKGNINFGSDVDITELARKTAFREDIGEFIALGSDKLSKKFGKDSYKFLYSVKGLEIAGHSARGIRNMGLGYATATRGGSHHDTRAVYLDPSEDPGFDDQHNQNVHSQNATALGDSLVMCRFFTERVWGQIINDSVPPFFKFTTGWAMSPEEIEKTGERIYNLERYINVKRGLSRKDDVLPYRVMNEPIPDGPSKGRCVPETELNKMLDRYYEMRGWDKNGRPTPEKLEELGITD